MRAIRVGKGWACFRVSVGVRVGVRVWVQDRAGVRVRVRVRRRLSKVGVLEVAPLPN